MAAALFDSVAFSCDSCALAPRLQKQLGCFDETPEPVATYAGQDFYRCPRTQFDSGELEVLHLRATGFLADAGARRQRALPAKLVEAINFVDTIIADRERAHRERQLG